ncbi:MAG: Rieske 2Fe-2S domain-containing protein [Phycisphaerales bacterium]|nr:MAG: Rieske 2Fe-2S domain-containing protein [Phycisphaerales bacterium]
MSNSHSKPQDFVFATRLADCPRRAPTYLEIGGRKVVLVRLTSPDRLCCVDALCPHEGASLAAGEVVGQKLICPQHHLKFDLITGACEQMPNMGLNRYATRIENGDVLVCPVPIIHRPPTLGT